MRVANNRANLYWGALATEIAGAIVILWQGVPIYRRFLTGITDQKAGGEVILSVVLAAVAIQVSYWWATTIFPSVKVRRSVILGHLAMFLARLNFVFAGAMLCVVMYVRSSEIEFSLWRFVVLIVALFSIFCCTLELERLGRRLNE
jgi:hypothetical protein